MFLEVFPLKVAPEGVAVGGCCGQIWFGNLWTEHSAITRSYRSRNASFSSPIESWWIMN